MRMHTKRAMCICGGQHDEESWEAKLRSAQITGELLGGGDVQPADSVNKATYKWYKLTFGDRVGTQAKFAWRICFKSQLRY